MSASCESPLAWDSLIAYWCGDLNAGIEEQIEEHNLGCAHCSRRLEQIRDLAQGVRLLARTSGVSMITSDAFVRRLAEEGLRVREYRVPLNGSVNCTIAPEDDFIVGHLEAPLAGMQRIDMLTLDGEGQVLQRQEDIPFAAESGCVVVVPAVETIRAMPKTTMHLRLLAMDDMGEQVLGDYKFHHTPPQP